MRLERTHLDAVAVGAGVLARGAGRVLPRTAVQLVLAALAVALAVAALPPGHAVPGVAPARKRKRERVFTPATLFDLPRFVLLEGKGALLEVALDAGLAGAARAVLLVAPVAAVIVAVAAVLLEHAQRVPARELGGGVARHHLRVCKRE